MQVCALIYASFIYTMYALSVQHINWVYDEELADEGSDEEFNDFYD